MDSTYIPVLDQLLIGQDDWESQQLLQDFKDIIGVIILLFIPLSIDAIAQLLSRERDDVKNLLDMFHSVLHIPQDFDTVVKPLHLSFRDFLLDSKKKGTKFWIDEQSIHQHLTQQCLEVMGCRLRMNICTLDYGTELSEVSQEHINENLPLELQYCCQYWAHHLERSSCSGSLIGSVFTFLEEHFLHWMEAMNVLGLGSEMVGIISTLQQVIQVKSPRA